MKALHVPALYFVEACIVSRTTPQIYLLLSQFVDSSINNHVIVSRCSMNIKNLATKRILRKAYHIHNITLLLWRCDLERDN